MADELHEQYSNIFKYKDVSGDTESSFMPKELPFTCRLNRVGCCNGASLKVISFRTWDDRL